MRRALAAALLVACGETDPLGLDAGASPDAAPSDAARSDAAPSDAAPDAGASPADAADLYDPDRLVAIDLELEVADWDALRRESRTLDTTIARPECLSEPFASPYGYRPAAVTIDGVRFPRVGVRKRGFLGSLSEDMPSLRLKLDEFDAAGEHLGVSALNLNNGRQDPSLVRSCLGLRVFARAGLPASRCNFARVTVNGRLLGVYSNVEVMKKPFLRAHFGTDDGHLYEGTLSDFRDGWLGTFEQETDEDVPYDRADLAGLTAALELPDGELVAAVEAFVDLERFFDFWAHEALVDHWDGYSGNTNNFYVYRPPGSGRFVFLPSGLDGVFGTRGPATPRSVFAHGHLARRLYLHPALRPRYLEAMRRAVGRFSADDLIAEARRDAALILPSVGPFQRLDLGSLEAFLARQRADIEAELDRGGADWTEPPRPPLCFDHGQVRAELATTFGTHPAPNVFLTGTGTLTVSLDGQNTPILAVGGSSGFGTNPDDANDVVLVVAATTPTGEIPIVYAAIAANRFRPGSIAIDGGAVRAALLRLPRLGAPIESVGFVIGGRIEVLEAGQRPGAPVRARIEAELLAQRPE